MEKQHSYHPKIFYLMGPSGVGKDTILRTIRKRLPNNVVIARRYITRPFDPIGEDHIPVSKDIFNCLQAQNQFAMNWQSHGNKYGIGREINEWLACGLSVIVNGSREWFPMAREKFSNLYPIVITISESKLKQRLLQRGRETPEQIELRLKKASAYQAQLVGVNNITNDGSPDEAAATLLKMVDNACQLQNSLS